MSKRIRYFVLGFVFIGFLTSANAKEAIEKVAEEVRTPPPVSEEVSSVKPAASLDPIAESTSGAEVAEQPAPEAAVAPPKPQGPAPEVVAAAKKRATAAKEVIDELDTTQWSVELKVVRGSRVGNTEEDRLSFDGRKVSSEFLEDKGYASSNISVTVSEDGGAVWETMQSSETGDVAFWRGEIQEAHMRGVMSVHPAGGDPEDYSFTATRSEGVPSGEDRGELPEVLPTASE